MVLLVIALVAAACGGSDDAGTAGEGGGGDESGGNASGDGSTGPEPTEQDFFGTFAKDVAALSTEPVSVSDLTVAPRGEPEAAPEISPVIDTCAALSGSALSSIVEAAAERDGLGGDYPFDDGTSSGGACTYESENHRIRVIIGSSDQVSNEPGNGVVMVPIGGDVSGSPWSDDSDVTLFSEHFMDLDTFFAAHAAAGDYGVVVNNAGGTGIDTSARPSRMVLVRAKRTQRALGATPNQPSVGSISTHWRPVS